MSAPIEIFSKIHTVSVLVMYDSGYSVGEDISSACTLIHSDDNYDITPSLTDGLLVTAQRGLENVSAFRAQFAIDTDIRVLSASCYDSTNDSAILITPAIRGAEVTFTRFLIDANKGLITSVNMDSISMVFTIQYKKSA